MEKVKEPPLRSPCGFGPLRMSAPVPKQEEA